MLKKLFPPKNDQQVVELISVKAYEEVAKKMMSPAAYGYFIRGADDEITLKRNMDAYDHLRFTPELFKGVTIPDTGICFSLTKKNTTLNAANGTEEIGTTTTHFEFKFPVGISPFAVQALATPDGEKATAKAAKEMNVPMIAPMLATTTIEEIATTAGPDTDLWFQLYWLVNLASTWSLIDRAEKAGFRVIVLTGDVTSIGKKRSGSDIRTDGLPPGMRLRNFDEDPEIQRLLNADGLSLDERVSSIFKTDITWEHLEMLINYTKLPVLVKGIMSARDALKALECGASGVIVSNSGGRTLDGTVATIEVLPEICQAVKMNYPHCPVFVDGGIRRGADVIKALALGAEMVFVGRPIVYGLATNGFKGAADVLSILHDEMAQKMQFLNTQTISELRERGSEGRLLRFDRHFNLGIRLDYHVNHPFAMSMATISAEREEKKKVEKLMTAAQTGDSDTIKEMMDLSSAHCSRSQPDSNTQFHKSAMLIAASSGRENVVKMLLDLGTDVNTSCPLGWTSLHLAAKEGHANIVRLVLQRGANASAKATLHEDPPGTMKHLTPLMLAAQNGHTEIAKLILDGGGKVTINAQEKNGDTALIHATRCGNLDLVKLLAENGADFGAQDKKTQKRKSDIKDQLFARLEENSFSRQFLGQFVCPADINRQMSIAEKIRLMML